MLFSTFCVKMLPNGSAHRELQTLPPLSLSINIIFFPAHQLRLHSSLITITLLGLKFEGIFFSCHKKKLDILLFFILAGFYMCTSTLSELMSSWMDPAQVLKIHFWTDNNIRFQVKEILLNQLYVLEII